MIEQASVHKVRMRMPQAFSHARATREDSEVIVFTVTLDGIEGAGECVARNYVTGETVDSVFAVLSSSDLTSIGRRVTASSFEATLQRIDDLGLPRMLRNRGRLGLAAACAMELALLDAAGKRFGISLQRLPEIMGLPASMRRVEGAVVPLKISKALDLTTSPEALRKLVPPPEHVKLKAGNDIETDVDRVRRVRELFGAETSISVDVNMAWNLEQAHKTAHRLRHYDVGWYEEPLSRFAWDDYRAFRMRDGARVMLDESLCTMHDGRTAIERRACDAFNIRVSKCGGLVPSLRLAALAHEHGLGIHVGVHPGQMGILGAASVQILTSLGRPAVCEGRGKWFGTGGFEQKIILEELSMDAHARRCDGLQPSGLGVTVNRAVLDAHSVAAARWSNGKWEKPVTP